MKISKLILAASIVVLASCSSGYKVTDHTIPDVPTSTQNAFSNQYPSATNVVWSYYDDAVVPIDWELAEWPGMSTTNDYVVRFTMDNTDYYSWYDSGGAWVGTAFVVNDYKTLPVAVNTMLSTEYPSYTITSAHQEIQKDRLAYEIELKNGDEKVKLLVNGEGTIIRQKTKS